MWKRYIILFMLIIAPIVAIVAFSYQYWIEIIEDKVVIEEADIVRIGGSTTIYPFARELADQFMDEYKEIVIVTQTSSGTGYKKLIEGDIDISNATRLPKEEELKKIHELNNDFVLTNIAKDSVAIIIHPEKHNYVANFTEEQLNSIFFTGEITDWSQLHPELEGKINVYIRDPETSGTASLFAKKISGSANTKYVPDAINISITPLVVPTLAADQNGIAYTPLQWVNSSVDTIGYGTTLENAVSPTKENIANGNYLLARDMYMVTLLNPKESADRFINYILGEKGDTLLGKWSFIR